jgi:hypothetical protein
MVLKMRDKVHKLVGSVLKLANDGIPNVDMAIEVLVFGFPFCQELEGQVDPFLEIGNEVMMLVIYV